MSPISFPHVLTLFHTFPALWASLCYSVTYSGETNALFLPPSGHTNTSFPVAWLWGSHKLGQMGA